MEANILQRDTLELAYRDFVSVRVDEAMIGKQRGSQSRILTMNSHVFSIRKFDLLFLLALLGVFSYSQDTAQYFFRFLVNLGIVAWFVIEVLKSNSFVYRKIFRSYLYRRLCFSRTRLSKRPHVSYKGQSLF